METPDADVQPAERTAAHPGQAESFKNLEAGPSLDAAPHAAPTQRVCFVLQVKPDRIEEYKRRHRTVWPEMLAALRETGWTNYSLFLRADGLLIGYLETRDFERARAEIARFEVNERWQSQMADFFVQPDGLLPDQTIVSIEEVFHL
jgi:L-rhamnose mutarotase